MRTAKELSSLMSKVYFCELEHCAVCHGSLSRCNYRSGAKTVQELGGVHRVVYQPKCCLNSNCEEAGAEAQQQDEIVKVLQQRIRYLLTLKGCPSFRLAGIEMYERLSEVLVRGDCRVA